MARIKYSIPAVYMIQHEASGMTYVGYAVNAAKRISRHKDNLRKGRKQSRKFRVQWNETQGKGWIWTILVPNPENPALSEITEILKVPEHLRLNTIVGHRTSDGWILHQD